MKVLILSDSHGMTSRLEEILEKEKNADIILHLGDGGKDLMYMNGHTSGKIVYQIKGNCDSDLYGFPPKLISFIGDIKFIACHGHEYQVKNGLTTLFYAAKQHECQIAFYGHTHTAFHEKEDGIEFFNPGSVRDGKYGIMEASSGKFSLSLKHLD